MVNPWHVHIKDEDFGPLFLKFNSSFDQLLGHIDQFVHDAKLAA